MTARVSIDPGAVDRLLQENGVGPLVERGATAVARGAGAVAPKGGPAKGVAESYKATKAEEDQRGVYATAYTDDIAGHLVEWGSINNPPYAPLRRGAERAGFRVKPAPKGKR